MQTPEPAKALDPRFKSKGAEWKQYSPEDLGDWVKLLLKRADMRVDQADRQRDLDAAQMYFDMLGEHLKAARLK